jgi:superfamily II DNA or RNA helicase
MVRLIVGNSFSRVDGSLPKIVHTTIRNKVSYQIPNYIYTSAYKRNPNWNGYLHLYKAGDPFYTGFLSFVRETLDQFEIPYKIVDRRIGADRNFPEIEFQLAKGFFERDYQNFTIDRCLQHSRGVIRISTGGGKTFIATKLIGSLKVKPVCWYILGKDLMYQAKETLEKSLNVDIGIVGDGVCDIKDVNVCMVQTCIAALNKDNKAFKPSDYKYDSDDVWDTKTLFPEEEKADQIVNLVKTAKGVYFDECVAGDSEIITEDGLTTISDAFLKKSRFVLTHDGERSVMKPILNWWSHGERETLHIKVETGNDISCTKEHPLFTKRGWLNAEDLTTRDEVLVVHEGNGSDLQYDTSWQKIESICSGDTTSVFDIEVEDTHSFFANGILVHNCHHVTAKTCKELMEASENAYWRFGGSATPVRESGDEIVIQGLFGKKVVDISASYLIKRDFLVPPYIFFPVIGTNVEGLTTYPSIYKGIRSPGAVCLTGKDNSSHRNSVINDTRNGKRQNLIATSLADEGLDIQDLDAVHMTGGGASVTRVPQRVGRVLRKPNHGRKKYGIAIYYHHTVKKLLEQGRKAKRVLKQEEEFNVSNSKSIDHLISQISNLENNNNSLF